MPVAFPNHPLVEIIDRDLQGDHRNRTSCWQPAFYIAQSSLWQLKREIPNEDDRPSNARTASSRGTPPHRKATANRSPNQASQPTSSGNDNRSNTAFETLKFQTTGELAEVVHETASQRHRPSVPTSGRKGHREASADTRITRLLMGKRSRAESN